jgi:hypothetical protein
MDAQKALPQIATAKVGIELADDERRQGPAVVLAHGTDAGPVSRHTSMQEGLIEGARLVGPSAGHSTIFALFSLLSFKKNHLLSLGPIFSRKGG